MSVDSTDLEPFEQIANGSITIFVSDPSAEADRLSTALRGRGYTVIDVPLSLLLARVAVQTPSLILLDIDAEGALDVASRLRDIPGAQGIDVLFLGDLGRTLSGPNDALRQEGSGFLGRPVDVSALIRKVDALVGARKSDELEPAEPPSMRAAASIVDRVSPNSARISRRTPPPQPWPERPSSIAAPEDLLEPSFNSGEPAGSRLPLPALSPEIERLLQGAEERSAHELGPTSSPAPEPPTPDEEVDAVLPAEVLAALDEPLDESDDDLESDSGLSTGALRKGGTAVLGVSTSSGSQAGEPGGSRSNASRRSHTAVREPPTGDPRFVSPSAYAAADSGNPKEKETPRPPRRGAAGASPAGMAPPARDSRVAPPARDSRTVPPAPPAPPAPPVPLAAVPSPASALESQLSSLPPPRFLSLIAGSREGPPPAPRVHHKGAPRAGVRPPRRRHRLTCFPRRPFPRPTGPASMGAPA